MWEWAVRAEAAHTSGAEYIGPERMQVQVAAAGPKMLDLESQESSCMGRFPPECDGQHLHLCASPGCPAAPGLPTCGFKGRPPWP